MKALSRFDKPPMVYPFGQLALATQPTDQPQDEQEGQNPEHEQDVSLEPFDGVFPLNLVIRF